MTKKALLVTCTSGKGVGSGSGGDDLWKKYENNKKGEKKSKKKFERYCDETIYALTAIEF